MPKVTPLKPIDGGPNSALIKALEEMLEEAKAGNLRGGAWVVEWSGSDKLFSNGWAQSDTTDPRIYEAEIMALWSDFVAEGKERDEL